MRLKSEVLSHTRDMHTLRGPLRAVGLHCGAGGGARLARWMDPVVTRPSTCVHGSEVHPPPTTLYRLYVLRKKGFRNQNKGGEG